MASQPSATRIRVQPARESATASPPDGEDERIRRLEASDAMVNFLEGWVVADLCSRFRTVVDAVYADTFEFQLVRALLEDASPQSLQVIASKCGASRTLVLPEGRLRRALERMERAGLVSKSGAPERPRYSLDRSNLTCHLLEKLYERPRRYGTLASACLAQSLGQRPQ